MGTPVWSHDGIVCTGESYEDKVRLTFAKGALLKDPKRLFNSSLDGNVRRANDILKGEEVDAFAFKALVHQAIALNSLKTLKPEKKRESLSQEPTPRGESRRDLPFATVSKGSVYDGRAAVADRP